MNPPHTSSAATSGLRNAPLLSAFALMLAFAFGVSGTAFSFDNAAQQLLPDDDSGALLADLLQSPDPVIVAHTALQSAVSCLPVHGCHKFSQSALVAPLQAFSARAPPQQLIT